VSGTVPCIVGVVVVARTAGGKVIDVGALVVGKFAFVVGVFVSPAVGDTEVAGFAVSGAGTVGAVGTLTDGVTGTVGETVLMIGTGVRMTGRAPCTVGAVVSVRIVGADGTVVGAFVFGIAALVVGAFVSPVVGVKKVDGFAVSVAGATVVVGTLIDGVAGTAVRDVGTTVGTAGDTVLKVGTYVSVTGADVRVRAVGADFSAVGAIVIGAAAFVVGEDVSTVVGITV
jgi:hypothetical protein